MEENRLATLEKWLNEFRSWEDKASELTTRKPFESLMLMLIGGSVIFYRAENEVNPKVKTFWDALNFISTCASVGYSDIFARTSTGKLVSSIVMTLGPALTSRVFDRNENTSSEQNPQLQAVLEKLDAILIELRSQRTG